MSDEPTWYAGWAEAEHGDDRGSYGWLVQTYNVPPMSAEAKIAGPSVMDLTLRHDDGGLIAIKTGAGRIGGGNWMPISQDEALKLARHLILAVRASRARGS